MRLSRLVREGGRESGNEGVALDYVRFGWVELSCFLDSFFRAFGARKEKVSLTSCPPPFLPPFLPPFFLSQEAVNGMYSKSNFFAANYCSDILYRLRQVRTKEGGREGLREDAISHDHIYDHYLPPFLPLNLLVLHAGGATPIRGGRSAKSGKSESLQTHHRLGCEK